MIEWVLDVLVCGFGFSKKYAGSGASSDFSFIFYKLNANLYLNYRNYCKNTVIYGRIDYAGGMNIGDEYL